MPPVLLAFDLLIVWIMHSLTGEIQSNKSIFINSRDKGLTHSKTFLSDLYHLQRISDSGA